MFSEMWEAPEELCDAIRCISSGVELLMGENLADDGNGIYEGTNFTLKSFSVDEDGAALFIWHPEGEPKFEVTWWQRVGRGTFMSSDTDTFTILVILSACLDEIIETYLDMPKPDVI